MCVHCTRTGRALISIIRSAFYLAFVRVIWRHLIKKHKSISTAQNRLNQRNYYKEWQHCNIVLGMFIKYDYECFVALFATIIDFYFDFMPSYAMVN